MLLFSFCIPLTFMVFPFSSIIAVMLQRRGVRLTIDISYLLIISVLFCLPGSAFPKTNWLSDIYFDKWVHIGFFALLIILWNWAANSTDRKWTLAILIAAIAYGLLVEFVQDNFIPNRGFDIGDWIADIAGSLLGWWVWSRYIKK
jgi:VanZ family protein